MNKNCKSSFVLLDGKTQAQIASLALAEEIANYKHNRTNYRAPRLVAVIVGDDLASKTYVKRKIQACHNCTIEGEVLQLPANCSHMQLKDSLQALAQDDTVDAILLQLPLPKHLDPIPFIEMIPPSKDADGMTNYHLGKLASGQACSIIACTPFGIWKLLQAYNIETKGSHVVILGRSRIVGRPLELLLSHKLYGNATVTLAHSATPNLKFFTRQADILIAAIGQPKLIDQDWIQEGAVVIDVGIHRLPDQTLCGDVQFHSIRNKARAATPVPGGVGPMTVMGLMHNSWQLYLNKQRAK